jgi:radical SAM protein with 4Fe4S-binding SPASM domain
LAKEDFIGNGRRGFLKLMVIAGGGASPHVSKYVMKEWKIPKNICLENLIPFRAIIHSIIKTLSRLRNRTVEKIDWCQGCYAKWHCSGDCHYQARFFSPNGQFRGSPRCYINRALILDQILENIAACGGEIWSGATMPPREDPRSVRGNC